MTSTVALALLLALLVPPVWIAAAGGADLDVLGARIDFYRVLGLYKLAVISEGIYARFKQGKTVGEGFANLQRSSVGLARLALKVADGSSSRALRGA